MPHPQLKASVSPGRRKVRSWGEESEAELSPTVVDTGAPLPSFSCSTHGAGPGGQRPHEGAKWKGSEAEDLGVPVGWVVS